MKPSVYALLQFMTTVIRSRLSLQFEIVALRHQFAVYQRTAKRPQIGTGDRLLWSWLSRRWSGWCDALIFVQTGTVISWQRKRFREHWANLSRHDKTGRPPLPKEIRDLIRKMSEANVSPGSPRIVGSCTSSASMSQNQPWRSTGCAAETPPSPTWKAFLNNHVRDLVSIDFLVVPTVKNKVLFGLVVLAPHRRRAVHFNVTEHPTVQWTAQQIIEAFPWDTAPKYLLRDRDSIFGREFQRRVRTMGIEEVITAPRSPWQNAWVERIIGSI